MIHFFYQWFCDSWWSFVTLSNSRKTRASYTSPEGRRSS